MPTPKRQHRSICTACDIYPSTSPVNSNCDNFPPSMASSAAAGLLGRQLKQMQGDKDIPGISCGLVGHNVFEWEVMLMISDECKYYGGV